MAAEHPYALRSSVTDDEIRQTAITCFNRECYLPMLSGDFLKMQSMEDTSQHISYSFDDLENIKKVAVSGLAAAILPRRRGMQDEVIRQHLVPVEIAKKIQALSSVYFIATVCCQRQKNGLWSCCMSSSDSTRGYGNKVVWFLRGY